MPRDAHEQAGYGHAIPLDRVAPGDLLFFRGEASDRITHVAFLSDAESVVHSTISCGGAVRKLLSSPAIQFKGSGWYITDYARAGKPDSANVPSGKTESGAAPAETAAAPAKAEKTETKPTASTSSE